MGKKYINTLGKKNLPTQILYQIYRVGGCVFVPVRYVSEEVTKLAYNISGFIPLIYTIYNKFSWYQYTNKSCTHYLGPPMEIHVHYLAWPKVPNTKHPI